MTGTLIAYLQRQGVVWMPETVGLFSMPIRLFEPSSATKMVGFTCPCFAEVKNMRKRITMISMLRMNKRSTGAAIAIGIASLLSPGANAATILVFGQTGVASEFSAVDNGNATPPLRVVNGSVAITGLDPNANISTPINNAVLNLQAYSMAPASVAGNALSQPFKGTFSITEGSTNILSGAFIDIMTGNESELALNVSTPPADNLNFTSDVIPVADLGLDRALSFSFTDVTPPTGLTNADGTFASFNASVSGNFSANNNLPVPEPLSLALLGTGLFGLGLIRARSK